MHFDLKKSLEILEKTPSTFMLFLKDLNDEWILNNEGADTWSPYDVIGHLIHGEKTDWLVRTKIILSKNENKKFERFDRFAQFEDSQGKSMNQLLLEFKNLRDKNLEELKNLNLTEKDLNMKGIHPELGVITLKELLATWVTHDLGHMAQISRVMAKQYKSEVGPWLQYITILNK